MQEYQNHDEISLRELIETLLKHKMMITLITVAIVIVTLLASLFILSPSYESKVILSITRAQNLTYNPLLLDALSPNLDLTTEDFLDHAISPRILESAITEMGLEDVTFEELMESINFEVLSPYLLQVTVERNVPEEAKELAGIIAVEIDDRLGRQINESMSFFLNSMEQEIKAIEESITTMENRLAGIDKYIVIERSILDLPGMIPLDEDRDRLTTVLSQELNPSYIRLEESIDNIRGEIDQKQIEYRVLENETEIIMERLETSPAMPSRIVQQDEQPRRVSPNIQLNLAIALVLGLMLSIFLAFFIEYWRTSPDQKQSNDEKPAPDMSSRS